MLMKYIKTAMHLAKYEKFLDDDTYYGEIPECKGVYANVLLLFNQFDHIL
jgi:hypothetical protein